MPERNDWHARQPPALQLRRGDSPPQTVVLPRVFRYMDQRYIEEFFDSGHLQLSSMARFREHADEARHDNEGGTLCIAVYQSDTGPATERTLVLVGGKGEDAYVLCGSQVESDELLTTFSTDGYFVIENPFGFADAIAAALPECREVVHGPCIYAPAGQAIHRRLDGDPIDVLEHTKNDDGTYSIETLGALGMQAIGYEVFFRKLQVFAAQAEYRFLWNVGAKLDDGTIDLHVPDAVQHCTKIT